MGDERKGGLNSEYLDPTHCLELALDDVNGEVVPSGVQHETSVRLTNGTTSTLEGLGLKKSTYKGRGIGNRDRCFHGVNAGFIGVPYLREGGQTPEQPEGSV